MELTRNPRGTLTYAAHDGAQRSYPPWLQGTRCKDGTGGICFAGSGGRAQRAGALAAAVTTSGHDCPRTRLPDQADQRTY
jgi:hypothetical protein